MLYTALEISLLTLLLRLVRVMYMFTARQHNELESATIIKNSDGWFIACLRYKDPADDEDVASRFHGVLLDRVEKIVMRTTGLDLHNSWASDLLINGR